MDLNGSTACYQHCSNGITMCVQNQWPFLKVEILNGLKNGLSVGGLINFVQFVHYGIFCPSNLKLSNACSKEINKICFC